MANKVSTGLRDAMLASDSLKGMLDGGKIRIFGGTAPVTADDAETGTLLCEISVNSTGDGITMDTYAVSGVLMKNPAEVWSGVNTATSTATHYRHVAVGDTNGLSTTEARIQGTVGLSGADLNLSSVNLVSGATQTIDYYSIALPTL